LYVSVSTRVWHNVNYVFAFTQSTFSHNIIVLYAYNNIHLY